MVSVVIPCFNSEKFLFDTITSVLNQSIKEYEVIVVDDGSWDKTHEIIKLFSSKVKAHFMPHCGVSAARNYGTKLAQGEYIQYLDSDDLLRPEALETRVSALESSKADVAYSNWQHLEEQEDGTFQLGPIYCGRIEDVDSDPEIAIFTDFWAPPAALLYRRCIVDEIGGWNESLPIIQDHRFLLDAALQGGRFIYVPGVGADYRVHSSHSLSRGNSIAYVRDCFGSAQEVERWWINHGGINESRKKALLKVYGYVARSSYENDKATFEAVYRYLNTLRPNFTPDSPALLAIVSRLVGYRSAESLGLCYRRFKKFIKYKMFGAN